MVRCYLKGIHCSLVIGFSLISTCRQKKVDSLGTQPWVMLMLWLFGSAVISTYHTQLKSNLIKDPKWVLTSYCWEPRGRSNGSTFVGSLVGVMTRRRTFFSLPLMFPDNDARYFGQDLPMNRSRRRPTLYWTFHCIDYPNVPVSNSLTETNNFFILSPTIQCFLSIGSSYEPYTIVRNMFMATQGTGGCGGLDFH